jgi:hypothetical protein
MEPLANRQGRQMVAEPGGEKGQTEAEYIGGAPGSPDQLAPLPPVLVVAHR